MNDLPDETDSRTSPGLRFHRPLFALAERSVPFEEGLPKVIDYKRVDLDGSVLIQFRVILSTPDLCEQCRNAVLGQERKLLAEDGLTEGDIEIEPWPLLHCITTIRDARSKQIIGVDQTDTLTGVNEFNVTLTLSSVEYAQLLDLVKKGDVEFIYSYSYVGTEAHEGTVDLKGIKNAKLVASQKLRSEQIAGTEPIFQSEANEAVRHVRVSVQRSMRITHKDLIPLLDPPSLYQQLFANDGEITLSELRAGDEKTATMLASYLMPHLEQVRESFGGEKSNVTINETREGESVGGNVNAGINLGFISFGGGISKESSKDAMRRLEEATGSKWVKDVSSETYRPHSIRKLKLQGGSDQVLIDETTTVFLSVGRENLYLEEPPVPIAFTTSAANVESAIVRPSGIAPYEGVPIGVMVPFFGIQLPRGYVWADGQAAFPNADWVPLHLRGRNVPDMREHLIGGAKSEELVGNVFSTGRIGVEPFTVDGTAFRVPTKTERVGPAGTGDQPGGSAGGLVVEFENMHGWEIQEGAFDQKPLPGAFRAEIHGKGYWAALKPHKALYAAPTGKVEGVQRIENVTSEELNSGSSNPRHVMCGWIIRIE